MFKINDRVRLKYDNKENPALTVRSEVNGQGFLCISDCGQRMIWATTQELELVESNFDLKEAIREVLLSDQFVKTFAEAMSSKLQQASVSAEQPEQPVIKRSLTTEPDPGEGYQLLSKDTTEDLQPGDEWWNHSEQRWRDVFPTCTTVPCPNTWYRRKVRSLQNQTEPPDGWRFLEVGELIRNGDKPVKGNAIPLLWVGAPCANNHFILRRNRFEVGEKVVDCRTEAVLTVQHTDKQYPIVFFYGVFNGVESKHLAPYIEEANEIHD